MNEEFNTLVQAKTWDDTRTHLSEARMLPSGIILRIRSDEGGNQKRFEGRLVARGNFQIGNMDYAGLYAPVACIEAICILLFLETSEGWCANHVDIRCAFTYASLPESKDDIRMTPPTVEDVPETNRNKARLVKSLYG